MFIHKKAEILIYLIIRVSLTFLVFLTCSHNSQPHHLSCIIKHFKRLWCLHCNMSLKKLQWTATAFSRNLLFRIYTCHFNLQWKHTKKFPSPDFGYQKCCLCFRRCYPGVFTCIHYSFCIFCSPFPYFKYFRRENYFCSVVLVQLSATLI